MDDAPDELLTIGKMASLNGISVRTLRFYQEKGLIEPSHVDERTCRRYYAIEQSTAIDTVSQLQAAGFSLDEIKELMELDDVQQLRDRLSLQLKEAEQRLATLQRARATTQSLLNGCEVYLHTPVRNQILFENVAPRHIITLSPPDQQTRASWEHLSPDERLELYQCYIRLEIAQRGYPPSYCNNVGILIPAEKIGANPDFFDETPFIRLDVADVALHPEAKTLAGGQSLAAYIDSNETIGQPFVTSTFLARFASYMATKGLEATGPLTSERIFNFKRLPERYPLYLMRVPVRSHNSWSDELGSADA